MNISEKVQSEFEKYWAIFERDMQTEYEYPETAMANMPMTIADKFYTAAATPLLEKIAELEKELHQQRFNNEHNLSIDQIVADKITQLEHEISVQKNTLEFVKLSIERNSGAYEKLQKERDEARKVIKFYGDVKLWTQEDRDYGMDRNIFTDEDEEFVKGKGHRCGKRAREFLVKYPGEEK